MKIWDAKQLAEATGGHWNRKPDGPIGGFAIDSRKLTAGQMFIALKTANRDGHDYLAAALKSGASAAMVSSAQPEIALPQLVVGNTLEALQKAGCWQRKQFYGTVVAVTGSSGKTSTKNLLKILLGEDRTFATPGNFNNHIGVPLSLLSLDGNIHQYAVLEAGMNRPGEIEILRDWIEPNISVVTSVGPAHLEGVGSIEDVAREKAALCRSPSIDHHAFFHYNCLSYGAFSNLTCSVHVLKAAIYQNQDSNKLPENFQTLDYTMTEQPEGSFDLSLKGLAPSGCFFRLPQGLTEGMKRNAALALSVALHLGIRAEELKVRLASWKPDDLRGSIIRHSARTWYLDCYNANPDSMSDALKGFAHQFPAGSRFFILGDMYELGRSSAYWHEEVGRNGPWQEGDNIWLIGREGTHYQKGIEEAGVRGLSISCSIEIDEGLMKDLRDYSGPVFLKGSRSMQFEKLYQKVEGLSC